MSNVEIALSMALRLWLSKLAAPEARKAAGRWLVGITAAGLASTFLLLALVGKLSERWFIAAIAWIILVYLPLRIFLEASAGWGGQWKRALIQQIRKRADRYQSLRSIALMVEWLFDRDVLMPRIAKPDHATKAREAAVAIIHRAMQTGDPPEALHRAATRCVGVVSRWTAHLALEVEVAPGAAQDVQAHWAGIRALATLVALTRVLIGAHEDMTGSSFTVADLGSDRIHAFLNDCLDYCDQIAFNLEGPPWKPPSAAKDLLTEETALALTASWQEYCQAPSNLPLQQYVQTLMD